MKIAVAGTGYVGLSIATLLSQNHEVKVTELAFHKVWRISQFLYIFGQYWNLQFLPAFHRHILNMNFTYSGPGKHFLYIMTMRC